MGATTNNADNCLEQEQPTSANADNKHRQETLTATRLRPEWQHMFNNKQEMNHINE